MMIVTLVVFQNDENRVLTELPLFLSLGFAKIYLKWAFPIVRELFPDKQKLQAHPFVETTVNS